MEFRGRRTVICGRFMKTGNLSSTLCVHLQALRVCFLLPVVLMNA